MLCILLFFIVNITLMSNIIDLTIDTDSDRGDDSEGSSTTISEASEPRNSDGFDCEYRNLRYVV